MGRAITLVGPIPVKSQAKQRKRKKKRVLRFVRDHRGLKPRWYDNPQHWTVMLGPGGRLAWHYNGPTK